MEWSVISPVDASVFVKRPYATEAHIESVLADSHHAQKSWAKVTLRERAHLCRQFIACLSRNAQPFSEEIAWQIGRPISQCPGELKGVKERADHMIDQAFEALADLVIANAPNDRRYIRKNPVGTVLIISPWNYPYLTTINSLIPALMAGNSVILKHASQTPLCAERLQQAADTAGLPHGVFQYLHLTHEQTDRLLQDACIHFVSFTGSSAAGRHIYQQVAKRNAYFISCGLELGGKDPAFVLKDAPLDYTLDQLVDGVFFNSGQSCCGIERIYVDHHLFNDFVEGFVARTHTYQFGNPLSPDTNLGPLVSAAAAKRVQHYIDEAIQLGATPLISARHFEAHGAGTAYLAPQVLINVDHRMPFMKEENFGPVVGIMPVKSEHQALELMNDSSYGLTASLWTQDLDRAAYLSDLIETGTCFTNRCDYLDPTLAWTGVKNTGLGISLSALGYNQLTQVKSYLQRV